MVDAEQMASNILETGRIALYGIYFDTDKTDIKPESKPTLDEIAALLANNRQLKLIVVGHTDNQGAFDYNMTLSKRRAQAVVEELVKSYDVSKDRLMAEGVGYLAPMATNTTEDGRGQNRRVELVEQ
jgi:outer membrane protein OmpA-like peptidoglycan-associated protein